MLVKVAMFRLKFDGYIMLMLVMLIMDVLMLVLQSFMRMVMIVLFRQVQPDSQSH
jgi:hypothetical protein